jgi:PAS domain S-box-containing protein
MAEKLTGIAAKDAFGRHYSQTMKFIKETDETPSEDFIREAIKKNKITQMANHTMLVKNDGTKIPVADSAAPIKNARGDIIGCVVVFHDVTREREIDKAKTEFVSLASHQLRTPLSVINWYAELLLSNENGILNPKQHQYAEEAYHASKRMVNLVNALLNVSRLELGTFTVEPESVHVTEIMKLCIRELQPQIMTKKLTIEESYDPDIAFIQADPKLLSIIFQNLLSNAVKYTPVEGKIYIYIKKQHNDMLITVRDTGIGIPEYQKEKIFTKLFRADNVHISDVEGSELGLYIVNEIIKAAGGKVLFES